MVEDALEVVEEDGIGGAFEDECELTCSLVVALDTSWVHLPSSMG